MFSPSNSLATPFGSTVMSPMEENGLATFEGGQGSLLRVKADWTCLLQISAFSFASVLRILFSLSDVVPNASFLRDLINDQYFLNFSGFGAVVLKGKYIGNVFPIGISQYLLYMCSEPLVMNLDIRVL